MRDKRSIAIGIVGVIAILLGTTVVTACIRGCSAERAGVEADQQAEPELQEPDPTDPGDEAEALLVGNIWEADGATLTFKQGRFIEVQEDGQSLTTFDVIQTIAQTGGYALTIRVDATQMAAAHDASITVAKDAKGVWTVASDEFAYATAYTQSAASREPVLVTGMTEQLLGLIDGDGEGIASAIQSYARASVPGAAHAAWTGEVLLDCNEGCVTTTFSCDDAARTLLTVMRDASGEYSVAG